ncbi:MAG: DUF1326 domain-containing protein [Gemmataceae bacterium]
MIRWMLPAIALLAATVAAPAGEITGQYVEARTCDVYTGPCFANADTGLAGRHAVLAWKIDKGTVNGTKLDGLSIVAVVAARDTLGQKQILPGKAVLIVDDQATIAQKAALIDWAKSQAGSLLENVVKVESAEVDVTICRCDGNACAKVKAGAAKVETRCLDAKHDKACGNETAFYPPLAKSVKAIPAMAVEHCFTGAGFNETWRDGERRGAYVGSFAAQ